MMTTYKNKSDMILSDDDDSYDMITTYKNKSDMLVLSRYLIALASQSSFLYAVSVSVFLRWGPPVSCKRGLQFL